VGLANKYSYYHCCSSRSFDLVLTIDDDEDDDLCCVLNNYLIQKATDIFPVDGCLTAEFAVLECQNLITMASKKYS